MIGGIDHLVVACADPDAAALELEAAIGIRCTGGGRHERLGTRNRIAWLADGSYIELIGIDDPELVRASSVGTAAVEALGRGGGLATYALLDDDLAETTRPPAFGPVAAGSRRRSDGELVRWWAAFPDPPLGPDRVPFLIRHAYEGAEWGPEAMAARRRDAHPLGSPVELVALEVGVADPAATAESLHDAMGLHFRVDGEVAVANVGPHLLRLRPAGASTDPATVTLAATAGAPRTASVLGLRFDVVGAQGYIR
jgi:hypothetical protein